MDRIKRFVQPAKLTSLILILICTFGFVYQVSLIFEQYMLGKTVTNIEVKRSVVQPLPAITVCIPKRFSISNLKNLNKKNGALYQDYMKLVNQITSNNNGNFTEKVMDKLREIYNSLKRNSGTVNFDQLFDMSLTSESISLSVFGRTMSYINSTYIKNSKTPLSANGRGRGKVVDVWRPIPPKGNFRTKWSVTETPINSFANDIDEGTEGIVCFTYFSALQEYWHSFQMDFKSIEVHIRNDYTHYPSVNEYLIAIHSPNILQKVSELDYFWVEPDVDYSITYSQLITELLVKGFESNCYEYNVRNEYGTIRMENDCRMHCIAQILKENYKSTTALNLLTLDLVRREHSSHFGNISTPINTNSVLNDTHFWECSEKCKSDCSSKQYFTVMSIKQVTDISYLSDNTHVKFEHNSIPDIIVRQSDEMSLMSFVCNFGGLLGMWLGFSILSISKDIFDFIGRIYSFDRIKINFFNNIKFKPKIFIIKSNASSHQNNFPMVEIDL